MSTNRVKRASTNDLMDDWLDSQSFYRKHIADDSSCLFRAVSEQIFNTQVLHMEVRNRCADYMEQNKTKFSVLIEDSFENHISNVRNPKEWGGQIELMAMSALFKCDFSVFQDVGKPMYKVTNNGHNKIIMLCQSSGNHYDSVYPKSFIQVAAFSQSIIYEVLYKNVFALGDEVDFAVETMLHDKVYAKSRKDSTASVDSNPPLLLLDVGDSSEENDSKDVGSEIRQALARGFPPFPYKVAKALDQNIYRNVEFDIWNESKKGEVIYEPGVKCLVRLDKNKPDTYHAHIQEMLPDLGPVTLYIVELGKKQTVPFECLEPLPNNKNYNSSGSYYQKQVNGSPNEYDSYKGRKKLFKKNKYKELQFSVSAPRGQSLPPRFQPQQPQHNQLTYNTSTSPVGRDREHPYAGISKNSQNIKWISTVSPTHRYRTRNSEGNKYVIPDVTFAIHENHNYKVRNNEKSITQPSIAVPTPLTWAKANGSMTTISTSRSGSNDGDRCSESMANNDSTTKSKTQLHSSPLPMPTVNQHAASITNGTSDTHDRLKDSSTTPPPGLQINQNYSIPDQSVISSPLLATSQPVTLFPYQYVGVCLPYEPPVHSVNYGTPRSRDPHGNDLPLHDLITLRFFYNLGHDYFRSATIIPMPTNQYHSAVWSYGPQVTYQAVSGYGTPASSLGNDSDSMTESPLSNNISLSPGEPPTNDVLLDGNCPKEFYEPTYLYDVSHINLFPNPFQPPLPIDYSSLQSPSVHSNVNEFKEGLVVNEQGILSLSTSPQCLPASTNTSTAQYHNQQQSYQQSAPSPSMRYRSDSGGSNRSQRNSNNWRQNVISTKFNTVNHTILNSTDSTMINHSIYSSPKAEKSSSSHNHWPSRYQQRVSASKPIPSPYNSGPPPLPTHHHHPPLQPQQPTTFPVMQAGSPIMTAASPTALGVYTGLGSPATYFGSPPAAALLYPQTHAPQTISYMTP